MLTELHTLKTLRLLNCPAAEEACTSLTEILGTNPLLLREMDLSGKIQGDSGVKQLSALLEDLHFRPRNLMLSQCELKMESCSTLSTVLSCCPCFLREIDLSNNHLQNSGVQQLCEGLKSPNCNLEILRLSHCSITEEGYAALASALISNPSSHLVELDLRGNDPGDTGVKQLTDLHTLKTLRLLNSPAAEEACISLTKVLGTNPLLLREMDLSEKIQGDSGVKQLSALLEDPHCRPSILKLCDCHITEEGYNALASALKSNPSSHLVELDLRGNDPGETGVKMLTELHTVKTLRVLKSPATEKACAYLTKILGTNPLLLREMDLSGKIQGDSGVKQLSALLEDSHFRPSILNLSSCSITEKCCAKLASVLCSNRSHLRELNLSGNKMGNAGVKNISNLLKESKLEKLKLSDCGVKEQGYTALASALKSNPSSHLVELDLRGNDPGDSGVKMLSEIPKLKLRLLNPAAKKACASLSEVLGKKPLLLRELKLSRNTTGATGDSRVKQLCALLQDSHCKLENLQIMDDDLTTESCSSFAEVLSSESCSLRQLDLSNNKLEDSGVKQLCKGLENPRCKLKRLRLSFCSITEEGYAVLASALISNRSSHLVELDLRGNDPGDSGVKMLTELHKLKTLRLLNSPDAEEACASLNKILRTNPLLLRQLDLSGFKPTSLRVEKLCALLQDPHYRLEKLTLYKTDSVTEEDCANLVSALVLNPSHLRELNLNRNKLDKSGVKNLCSLLGNPDCKLEKLKLCKCNLTADHCEDLLSALCSNPSHLRELDLSENQLRDAGIQKLTPLLQKCKLQKLLLNNCSLGNASCDTLALALTSNCSHLRDLDLRGNKLGDSVKKLSDLLKESGCILQLDSSWYETFLGLKSYLPGFARRTTTRDHSSVPQCSSEGNHSYTSSEEDVDTSTDREIK